MLAQNLARDIFVHVVDDFVAEQLQQHAQGNQLRVVEMHKSRLLFPDKTECTQAAQKCSRRTRSGTSPHVMDKGFTMRIRLAVGNNKADLIRQCLGEGFDLLQEYPDVIAGMDCRKVH